VTQILDRIEVPAQLRFTPNLAAQTPKRLDPVTRLVVTHDSFSIVLCGRSKTPVRGVTNPKWYFNSIWFRA
jgi:hypothetical protein